MRACCSRRPDACHPAAHRPQVRDSAGNLNGAHPSSHGDPSLHAWVAASSRQRLDAAVALLLEVLQPTNTQLRAVAVSPGGSVVLRPCIPPDWPQAAEAAAAEAAEAAARQAEAGAAAAASPAKPPPPPAANAWASNRLLKQLPDARQFSPVSSLQRSRGPTGSSNASSEAEEGDPAPAVPARAAEAAAALPPPPPPPPPRRSVLPAPAQAEEAPTSPAQPPSPVHPPSPMQPSPVDPDSAPASPMQAAAAVRRAPAPARLVSAASAPLSPTQRTAAPATPLRQQAVQQQVATVWATGLHTNDAAPELVRVHVVAGSLALHQA